MTTALRASDSSTRAALPARNPGTPLDLSFLTRTRINRSAVERRAATLTTRRTVKKEWQAAWLLRAVSVMDLTTLSGDDTPGNVQRLCAKARQPVRDDLLEALGMAGRGLHTSAPSASTTRACPTRWRRCAAAGSRSRPSRPASPPGRRRST